MKIAVCFTPKRTNTENCVSAMAEAMRLTSNQRHITLPLGCGAVASVSITDEPSAFPSVLQGSKGNILVIAGVPIKLDGSLGDCLKSVIESDYEQAIEQLTTLDGAFAAIFWDANKNILAVVTDPLGLQPLYIARPDGEGLLIASELKAFAASGLMGVEIDPAGWGSFFSLDFNIGERTQLEGASRIKSANILTYDAITDKLSNHNYWFWPDPDPGMGLDDLEFSRLLDITRQEIKCYSEYAITSTLPLSGGFDSRLLLALLNEQGLHCPSMILQHQDELFGMDGRIGVKVAKKHNEVDYTLISSSPSYFESPEFLKYLVMGEVAVPCLNLFIAQVSQNLRPEMKAVWDGLLPGCAFFLPYANITSFEEYLRVRCRSKTSLHWEALRTVFAKDIALKMEEDFSELFNDEVARFTNDQFGITQYQMDNRKRRCIALNPMTVYANKVLPFIPCVSRRFWDIAGRIPRTLTINGEPYLKLYKEYFPQYTDIPFSSGGSLFDLSNTSPLIKVLPTVGKLYKRSQFYWRQMGRLPIAGKLFTGSGVDSNRIVEQTIQSIEPDHKDLNPDAVRLLKQMKAPYDWKTRISRHHLFYWQIWRWVMTGELTTWNAEIFLQERLKER